LPAIVRAVITGVAVAGAGTTPWAVLVKANTKHLPTIPWAVVPTTFYMWLFWRYIRGAGWPRSTAETRRTSCRANPLPPDVWVLSLLAGGLGLASLVLFMRVMNRLVRLPAQQGPDVSHIPLVTLFAYVLMSAIVAGVAEESAFRGYMQGGIERRHGPVVAILVTGGLFGFAHFSHPEVGFILLPYYLAAATVYGALAYLTNSIYPSMALHAGGNILGSIGLFARGQSEWQAPASPKPLIRQGGPDASFWIGCGLLVMVGIVTVLAYAVLGSSARRNGIVAGRNRHAQS
jgi:membrane protease YdiL (CAAX protease family)